MKSFNRIEDLVKELKRKCITKIIVLVEATGNGGRTAEVCRELDYEPILLTAGKEKKYSKSVRDLRPEVLAIENSSIYDNGYYYLRYCIHILKKEFNLVAIITPNEAPAKIIASLSLDKSIKKTLPHEHYSSKITQREKLAQPVPRWRIIKADDIYDKLKDQTGKILLKQHLGVGKRGIYVCKSKEDIFKSIRSRELINNYGVPVDDNRLIIEEYVPHTIEMSCDIATFNGINYLIGSPVYKRSGGNSGIIEVSHRVGGWLKSSSLTQEQILLGIKKAKEGSSLMSIEFNRIDHVELMIDERTDNWIITEVNFGRPGGDFLPWVQRIVLNIDPIKIGLEVLLGKITKNTLEKIDKISTKALLQDNIGLSGFFIANKPGKVVYNQDQYTFYKKANKNILSINLDVEVNSIVTQTTTSYDRYGHYILMASNSKNLNLFEKKMLENINFQIV